MSVKYSYHYAKIIAEAIIRAMTPYCERCEVSGDLRRECAEISIIEICAIAKTERRDVPLGDLFGSTERRDMNTLHADWAEKGAPYVIERVNVDQQFNIRWLKRGKLEDGDFDQDWPVAADDKFWRGLLPDGLKVGIHFPTLNNWGVIFLFQTGSKFFNMAIASHARDRYMAFEDGWLTKDKEKIATPEESDVFNALGLRSIHPRARAGQKALHIISEKREGI